MNLLEFICLKSHTARLYFGYFLVLGCIIISINLTNFFSKIYVNKNPFHILETWEMRKNIIVLCSTSSRGISKCCGHFHQPKSRRTVNEACSFSIPVLVGLKTQVLQRQQHIVLVVMVSLWEFAFVFILRFWFVMLYLLNTHEITWMICVCVFH